MRKMTYQQVISKINDHLEQIKICRHLDDEEHCLTCKKHKLDIKLCRDWIKSYVVRWVKNGDYLDLIHYDRSIGLQQMSVVKDEHQNTGYYAKFYYTGASFKTQAKAKRWVERQAEKLGLVIKNKLKNNSLK